MTVRAASTEWQLVGIWRTIAVLAALDVALVMILVATAGVTSLAIAIAVVAFTAGVAATASLAFWARDRWLKNI